MNYYEPKQREDDKKWDFACHNDNQKRTWPVGFCAAHSAEERHDTPEEAAACYQKYLIEQKLVLDAGTISGMQKCEVCGTMTNKVAKAGPYVRHLLCDEHRTADTMARLMADLGSFFGSY
jgi:hypothetical protein